MRERAWFVRLAASLGGCVLLACGGSAGVGTSSDGGGKADGKAADGSRVDSGSGARKDAGTSSACHEAAKACAVGTDCCTGACVAGKCAASQCVSIGDACPGAGNACCTDTCVAGKCAPIGGGSGPACRTAGNSCTSNGSCCSGLCSNGTCNIASSYCTQTGDICYAATDCCGGVCNSPDASPISSTNPGTCALPPSVGGTNCSGVDGILCDPTEVGCAAGCCSHLCAPFGPTGITICQQAQGCHVEGDLCRHDSDCCGGESADSGLLLGAGKVTCTIPVGGSIGVCTTPTSSGSGGTCVPEGDVCHYTSGTGDAGYTCSSSSARSDCCGPQTPKFLACLLDKLGVPRCLAYGLNDSGVGACREPGGTCAAAADCCGGNPCVPSSTGQLECATTTCIPATGACTSTADCCAGVTCVLDPGATAGTCKPLAPPGGSGDGGTTDAGRRAADAGLGCAAIGQSCTALACCSGLDCAGGSCVIVLK